MGKRAVCICGIVVHMFFLLFWSTVFIWFSVFPKTILPICNLVECINIGSIGIWFFIFAVAFRLTYDEVIEAPGNPKIDRFICGGVLLVLVAVVGFGFLVAFYCNINAHYLTDEETMRYFHIPPLFLANYFACVACYMVHQFFHQPKA